ncbi:MAG: restriction endonuclease subunit R [Hormoscilla sp. GUM202]|nr:restriction endonuclease subunit R [Hormoscilla sp. GUM202]
MDGEDKKYGYIVDYKNLFEQLEGAVTDYTTGAFDGYDAKDIAGLLSDRLTKGRDILEETRATVEALCEPVPHPGKRQDYLHYFCNEPKRVVLYKCVNELIRAYANLANEMPEAGYSQVKAEKIKAEVKHYSEMCKEIKIASGDYLDMKLYEPAMRHLLDSYIRAEDPVSVSDFEELGLIQLILQNGAIAALEQLPEGLKQDRETVAYTIENNLRKIITSESPVNPEYYDKMSELLDDLIAQRRQQAIEYHEYLEKVKELAKRILEPHENSSAYPESLDTPAKRSLYDNLGKDKDFALAIDNAVRDTKKEGWIGNRFKERELEIEIKKSMGDRLLNVKDILEIVKNQDEYK